MKSLYTALIIFCSVYYTFAQNGKLLLVGGGTEQSGTSSWNYLPYKWAVDNSGNKRVAIISYNEESTPWLREYLTATCGAAWVKHFQVASQSEADQQALYDTLVSYGMVFFKGGDQYKYYTYYKGTKLQAAVEKIFAQNGVIAGTSAGMAILSKVCYTAQRSSATPAESAENFNNSNITLANDFLPFLPGYVVDTHFAERGRMPRLVAFMSHWKNRTGEMLTGIGVDDISALAIDENMLATAYGAGTVCVYKASNTNTFNSTSGRLLADSISVNQLVQGCQIDLKTGVVSGLKPTLVKNGDGTLQGTLLLSGGDMLGDAKPMLEYMYANTGLKTDKILIITGNNTTLADAYKTLLTGLGAADVKIASATTAMLTNATMKDDIQSARKFIFVGNTATDLMAFLAAADNGALLKSALVNPANVLAFTGDNASFDGNLRFLNGINLVSSSVIMPNTYQNAVMYENSITSVPYCMAADSVKYGIWLNGKNFVKFSIESEYVMLYTYGTSPVMFARNSSTGANVVSQTSKGTGTPRQLAGLSHYYLSFMDENSSFRLEKKTINTNVEHADILDVSIFPNPAQHQMSVVWPNEKFSYTISDISGRIVLSKHNCFGLSTAEIGRLIKGMYLVNLKSDTRNVFITKKIIVE